MNVGLLDVLVMFVLLGLADVVVIQWIAAGDQQMLEQPLTDWPLPKLLQRQKLTSAARLTVLAISVILFWTLRVPEPLQSLRKIVRRLPYDIGLGIVAFLMIVPPVLALQKTLVQWIPYEHPLIDLVTQHRSAEMFVAIATSAVIVAPLVEEFFCRRLLQQWVYRGVMHTADPLSLVVGESQSKTPAVISHMPKEPWLKLATPIIASSAVFALLHVGQGPGWISLFFFALALGYITQQTGRITAAIVVHALLNGLTVMNLVFSS